NRISYKLNYYPSKGTPEGTLKQANHAVNQDGVGLLFLITQTQNSLPVVAMAERAQIPTIAAASTNIALTKNLSFVRSTSVNDELQAKALVRYLKSQSISPRISILFEQTDVYNREMASLFKRSVIQYGGEIVDYYGFINSPDFKPTLRGNARGELPKYIFILSESNSVKRLADELRKNGFMGRFIGSDLWEVERLKVEPSLQGSLLVDQWHPDFMKEYTLLSELYDYYQTNIGLKLEAGSVRVYDGLLYAKEIVCRSDTLDANQLASTMRQRIKFDGASGTYVIDKNGVAYKPLALIEFNDYQAKLKAILPSNLEHNESNKQ
ncbi:MAG: hypothetical protein CUN55_15050, partial [Phototrophicales bacterium]